MTMYDFFSPFEHSRFFATERPSVYVISDSELARYKRENALREIAAVERLIESHRNSIERLESTVELLKRGLPALPKGDEVSESEQAQ